MFQFERKMYSVWAAGAFCVPHITTRVLKRKTTLSKIKWKTFHLTQRRTPAVSELNNIINKWSAKHVTARAFKVKYAVWNCIWNSHLWKQYLHISWTKANWPDSWVSPQLPAPNKQLILVLALLSFCHVKSCGKGRKHDSTHSGQTQTDT